MNIILYNTKSEIYFKQLLKTGMFRTIRNRMHKLITIVINNRFEWNQHCWAKRLSLYTRRKVSKWDTIWNGKDPHISVVAPRNGMLVT